MNETRKSKSEKKRPNTLHIAEIFVYVFRASSSH